MSSTNPNTGVTGVPNKTKIIKIEGNTIPTAAQQPNKAVVQPPAAVVPAPAVQQQKDPNDVNIDEFIASGAGEIKTGEEKESERQRKTKLLTKAIESRFKFERIIFNNSETGEFVGTKMQYVKDEDGKTVYDYVNDPAVNEHIQFVVPEDDPQDGSPVNKQITFFWTKPTF
jgi:hypothetical protein